MKRLLSLALVGWLASIGLALAQSSVNPGVPAQNAPLASAPVRSNFTATFSDINGLILMHPAASLAGCSVQTVNIGADCLITSNPSAYAWYKYTGANGYVLVGTINPSTSPPTFSAGLPPIPNAQLIANCTGATAIPSGCTWNAFATQAIGSTNGIFPYYSGGAWGTASTGTAGHTVPFLDATGVVFTYQIASGVAGSAVGGYCMANATSGSICIAPVTGALGTSVATFPANSGVVAELNLAQTWSAVQTFQAGIVVQGSFTVNTALTLNLNTAALPASLAGTALNIGQADGVVSRVQVNAFGQTAEFTTVAYGGTNSAQTQVLAGAAVGRLNAYAYNGTALSSTAIASIEFDAAENIASGHQGSIICLKTTPTASTTLTPGLCQQASGGATLGAPTGGDQGIGTFNLSGSAAIYSNGVAPTGTGAYVRAVAPALGITTATSLAIGGCTLAGNVLCTSGGVGFTTGSGSVAVTSISATALFVSANGTNSGFVVDESTTSAVTGVKIKSAAAAAGVAISVTSTASNEALTIDALGTGTICLGCTSTGSVNINRALTYGGTTFANTATGSGSLVGATGPSIVGPGFSGTFAGTYALGGTPSLASNLAAGGHNITGIGTLAAVIIQVNGSTSGSVQLLVPAIAGSNSLTFPAGTTDFSSTGGTSQVVKQTSAGGAFTVAQLAIADISGYGTNVATALGTAAGSANGFPRVIAPSGTVALGTSAIASGACATVVTVAATGILTTDVIDASFNSDPTAITGYVPLAMLTIVAYPTAGNANFKVCNNTGSSVTPSAVTLNWAVRR